MGTFPPCPMPLLEVRRRYSEAEEVAIIDAVHDALVAAFLIPRRRARRRTGGSRGGQAACDVDLGSNVHV
jgi:hypothetical protein